MHVQCVQLCLTDDATIDPTHDLLKKLNPPVKSDLAHERKAENPKSMGTGKKKKKAGAPSPTDSLIGLLCQHMLLCSIQYA